MKWVERVDEIVEQWMANDESAASCLFRSTVLLKIDKMTADQMRLDERIVYFQSTLFGFKSIFIISTGSIGAYD